MLDWQTPNTWSVLIVDDEPDNLDLVSLYFTFLGATVTTASNGQEGMECLKTLHPDLILLDLSMPKMDGWEMMTALQTHPTMRDVPVVALTAHAMPADRIRVHEAGFNGYIVKPINLPTLMVDLRQTLMTFSIAQEQTNASVQLENTDSRR
jgi:CheY-like chemotaxis protein